RGLALWVSRRCSLILGHKHSGRKCTHCRIGKGVRTVIGERDRAMGDALCNEHRDGEATTERRAHTLLPHGCCQEEGLNVDALNEFGRKSAAQLGGEVINEVERSMCVASGRKAL